MKKNFWINCLIIAALIFGCLPVTIVGGVYAYQNREALMSYLPAVQPAQGGDEPVLEQLKNAILTPGAVDYTPIPGATQNPGTPTPTPQPVDKLRTLAPRSEDFQSFIRRANVIQGKNVLLLASGEKMYGYGEYYDAIYAPVKFPLSFLIGKSEIKITDETFRVTLAANIDESVYLPAILSQAVVIPDLTAKPEKVVINQGAADEEVVEMQPGIVTLPYVSSCWTGFGILPWEQRFEPGAEKRFEKVTDAVFWLVTANFSDQDLLMWAMPRIRFAAVRASYNAILPYDGSTRTWRELDKIHEQSKELIMSSSGEGNVPSAYDLILGYFNLHANEFGFSRITTLQIGTFVRGTVYCASDNPLWDAALENTLTGPVPASFLLNPADLRPEIAP